MKAFVLALLASVAAVFTAHAETRVSGFQPRFSTSPAYPDEPNYRPANRPPNTYEFTVDVSPEIQAGRDYYRQRRDPPRRQYDLNRPNF